MTTFKSQSAGKVTKKEFISIKTKSKNEINQIRNFSGKNINEQKAFIGGILASKSSKQNKKTCTKRFNLTRISVKISFLLKNRITNNTKLIQLNIIPVL